MVSDYIEWVNRVEAAAYYDEPDEDDYIWTCLDCRWFEACKGGCGWGLCEYKGEQVKADSDACPQLITKEDE